MLLTVYLLTCSVYLNGVSRTIDIKVVHESSAAAFEKLMQDTADAAKEHITWRKEMWRQFYKLRDMFARVNYSYATTGHKSQGSTYTNALVLQWDILDNSDLEERNRILYVSCSRPTDCLYIEP